MAKPDPNATFAGYAALCLIGGLIAVPQIGFAGLIAAGAAVYGGACFMRGYMTPAQTKRRKR